MQLAELVEASKAIAETRAKNAKIEHLAGVLGRLSTQEAAAIRPRVIDIVTVGAGDTVQSLAGRMAYSNYQTERFRLLNGLDADDTLQRGQRVKLVVYGRR